MSLCSSDSNILDTYTQSKMWKKYSQRDPDRNANGKGDENFRPLELREVKCKYNVT